MHTFSMNCGVLSAFVGKVLYLSPAKAKEPGQTSIEPEQRIPCH